jgi:hypothetical protein
MVRPDGPPPTMAILGGWEDMIRVLRLDMVVRYWAASKGAPNIQAEETPRLFEHSSSFRR